MRVAFHSYKGGVGRTQAMIGVSAILAMRGRKVGMLDFDLDASGLASVLEFTNDGSNKPKELIKVLRELDLNITSDSLCDAADAIVSYFGSPPPEPGFLKYLPTKTNPVLSDPINLKEIAPWLNDLFKRVEDRSGAELLNIDLKPGWSPAFKAVLPSVRNVVLVTRIDEQNIAGLEELMPTLKSDKKSMILVVNMVPDDERKAARLERLQVLCNDVGAGSLIEIPFDIDLQFDATLRTVAAEESGFRKGLDKLADRIEGK